jgi:hypothetical protein
VRKPQIQVITPEQTLALQALKSLTTFRPLSSYLSTTFRLPFDYLSTTFRLLFDHFSTTFRPLFDHFPAAGALKIVLTNHQLHISCITYYDSVECSDWLIETIIPFDYLSATFRPLFDHFPATFRLPFGYLSATFRPLSSYLSA